MGYGQVGTLDLIGVNYRMPIRCSHQINLI
jgi:hypothetical protein